MAVPAYANQRNPRFPDKDRMADAIVLTKALHHPHISWMTTEIALDPGGYGRRSRACLRCKTDFDSAWAGERICLRCKGSSAWRNGGGLDIRGSRPRSKPVHGT